ncbi:MAG: DUF5681 domain-containing protein [Candidatus Sulfotelmatobacter sp.]
MNNGNDEADATMEPTQNDKTGELPAATAGVGFRRPPDATRFKKGVSGNPRGRPKGSLNVATAFMKALREKVVINEHGQRKTITKLEAALKQLANKGASGDLRALTQLIALAQDAEVKQNVPGAQEPVTSELDQEVMEGILRRFVKTAEQQDNAGEENNGDIVDTERG